MSKRNVTKVPASTVRAWARANVESIPEGARAGLGETARGRLHPEIVKAFTAANPGQTYETGAAETPTVEVPAFNKKGNRTGRTVSLPRSEVRALVGAAGKGRIPEALLLQAGRVHAGLPRTDTDES